MLINKLNNTCVSDMSFIEFKNACNDKNADRRITTKNIFNAEPIEFKDSEDLVNSMIFSSNEFYIINIDNTIIPVKFDIHEAWKQMDDGTWEIIYNAEDYKFLEVAKNIDVIIFESGSFPDESEIISIPCWNKDCILENFKDWGVNINAIDAFDGISLSDTLEIKNDFAIIQKCEVNAGSVLMFKVNQASNQA